MQLLKDINIIKYFYVFVIVLINYLISYLLNYFIIHYIFVEWHILSTSKYILFLANLINLIIVVIQWYLFNKKLKKIDKQFINRLPIIFLYLFIFVATALYQLYIIGEIEYIQVSVLSKKIFYIISFIVLIPIFEELIYRDILVRVLINNNNISIGNIVYISLLFTLIHIISNNINWLYLFFVFIIGAILLLIRLRKGLLASIIVHSLVNLIVFLFRLDIW